MKELVIIQNDSWDGLNDEGDLQLADDDLYQNEYDIISEESEMSPLTDMPLQTEDEFYSDDYEVFTDSDDYQNRVNRRRRAKILISVFSIMGVLFAISSLVFLHLWYKTRLHLNTTINGVNMSNLSADQAYNRLYSHINGYALEIIDKYGSVSYITSDDVGLHLGSENLTEAISDIIAEQSLMSIFVPKNYEIDCFDEVDEDALLSVMQKSEVLTPKEIILSENAYISFDENTKKYIIVPEVQGNVLREGIGDIIKDRMMRHEETISLLDEGLYIPPDIKRDDELLLHNLSLYNEYIPGDYMIDMDGAIETLSVDEYRSWFIPVIDEADDYVGKKIDASNPFTIDESLLRTYMDYLYKNYNTFGSKRDFVTVSGANIKLTQGDYGWWINYKDTMSLIKDTLLSKSPENQIEAVYHQKAAQRGDKDYGNSYVEINLTSQTLWLIMNGEAILTSGIVTGRPSTGNATPPGIYSITYKERNATLRGPGYETPVSYWMPFNRDIGLHDATWQSAFGGSRYITHGSHGCVNLPFDVAKNIYSYVDKEFPVVLYY